MPDSPWHTLSCLAEAGPFLASCHPGDPFMHPAFLGALEGSGVVGPDRSWSPAHRLLMRDDGQPLALLPLYRKQDSRGEYVFDHGWADAYQRHGLAYYPKLVTAVPFTPVPGPRLLLAAGASSSDCLSRLFSDLPSFCMEEGASGWHGLFVEESWLPAARDAGLAVREGCRFHWQNPGYRDFPDFLDTLTSKKRKDLKRERRLLAEQNVRCQRLAGKAITETHWDFFHECYVRTYLEHGQRPYLNRDFFRRLANDMPEQLLLVLAEDDDGPMASALFLHNDKTLYGRYWGSLRRADGLHFEVCYYQGMEFCMETGLTDFDPGTQGEHKLLRGFAPVITHSLHWLVHPEFRKAVANFVREESAGIRHYAAEASRVLPYRRER